MSDQHVFRAGDVVFHVPSGETWVIAAVDTKSGYVFPAGWPETRAEASDCNLLEAASDEKHKSMLAEVLGSGRLGVVQARYAWAEANMIDEASPQLRGQFAVHSRDMRHYQKLLADSQRSYDTVIKDMIRALNIVESVPNPDPGEPGE
jgi:hypothetical protein